MTVIASAQITVSLVAEVDSVWRYYLLQGSTLSAPQKPGARPPAGWSDAEPAYQDGSTNSLYTVDLTVFSDGSWAYSEPSLSSSYEAAKAAYNEAKAAMDAAAGAAKTATNYIADTDDGVVVGDMRGEELGFNTLQGADGFHIRNGGVVLASFLAELIRLGIGSDVSRIEFCGGRAVIHVQDVLGTGKYYDARLFGADGAYLDTVDSYFGVQPSNAAGGFNAAHAVTNVPIDVGLIEPYYNWGLNVVGVQRVDGDDRTIGVRAARENQAAVWMGVGSGGINHGVYSETLGSWIVKADGENITLWTPNGQSKPYYTAGDSFSVTVRTAGYCTSTKTQVVYCIPLGKPIHGVSSVSVTTNADGGYKLRQGGAYTHGSGASAYVRPNSHSCTYSPHGMVFVTATFGTTTNAVNNDAIGVEGVVNVIFNA